jgi:hypothetical protein
MLRSIATAVFVLSVPATAFADDAGTIITLTPAQIESAKEAGAARNARQASDSVDLTPRDRAIHGEVGFAVGTGGYSAIYGTAVAPLGNDGIIALSLANERFGQGSRYRR